MFDKRAMLVELTIRQWTARKHDRKVSREVDQGHGAQNAGRFNKQLIAKDALEKIAKKAGAIREFHYAHTLPWGIFTGLSPPVLPMSGIPDRFLNTRPLKLVTRRASPWSTSTAVEA